MRNIAIGAVAALLLGTVVAAAQGPVVGEAESVKKASVGNTFEVQEAQLAIERATDGRLKAFAQKMIADHTDAEKKLEAAASKAGHKTERMLDPVHQAMIDNLRTFTGTDFDKIYMADQIQSHTETVALLSDYKAGGKNKTLQSWADDTLPTVKMHLADIDAM